MRSLRLAAGTLVVLVAACSGGGGSSQTTSSAAANPEADLEAARVCRMWTETTAHLTTTPPPNYAALDAMSAAIAPIANQAGADDSRWSQLALDIAGANDFQSAALPDVNTRILKDCKAVPATATKTVASEPDPFSTTTTVPATTSTTG